MSSYGTYDNIEGMTLEEIQDALESFEFEMLMDMSADDRKALESNPNSRFSFLEWLDQYFTIHGSPDYKRLLEERGIRGVHGPDEPSSIRKTKYSPINLHAFIYGHIASMVDEYINRK